MNQMYSKKKKNLNWYMEEREIMYKTNIQAMTKANLGK